MSQSNVITRRMGRFSSATLISRVLGYARDACVAYYFGGTLLTDVFYTAFRTTNLFRRILGEGALSSAFIPIFSKSLIEDDKDKTQNFLSSLFTFLLVVLIVLTGLGIWFAPEITYIIAPGFKTQPEKFQMTILLTRWMFPFFLFISLAALATGVLNSLKRFFLPAVAPAMLSISEIGYLLFVMRYVPLDIQLVGLAASVAVGGAAHFLIQVPSLVKEKFYLKLKWEPQNPHSVQVGKLMIPAMIGLSVDQINVFVNTICATYLVEGSVTALYNSNRLMQLPLALFGIALATVSLPLLSEYSAEKNYSKMGSTINESLRMVLYVVTPAMLGLMILGTPIVKLLFEHGKFTPESTRLTVIALWGYSAGLLAYSAVKILANAFYALREPKIPIVVAAWSMGLNVVLSIILMWPFGVGGLAWAAAISSWVNALALFLLIRKRLGPEVLQSVEIVKTGLKSIVSAGLMFSLVALFFYYVPGLPVYLQVFIGVLEGVLIYFSCTRILAMREQQAIFEMIGFKSQISK